MTTKHLTGLYASGYTLGAAYSTLIVDKTAQVLGSGITTTTFASVTNYGSIQASGASTGVYLAAGGALTNGSAGAAGALISGSIGVYTGAGAVTVTNFGTIQGTGGVAMQFKSSADRLIAEAGSTIRGVVQGGGGALELTLATGTISGLGASGIVSGPETLTFSGFGTYVFDAGGSWTLSGTSILAANQTLASQGSVVVTGSMANGGSIIVGAGSYGLILGPHGTITNGNVGSATALIQGYFDGIYGQNGAAETVTNFGTIRGINQDGVQLTPGGRITNGGSASTNALIRGGNDGIYAAFSSATVTNFGTVTGAGSEGVLLGAGGSVANSSASVTTALIQGYFDGVYVNGAAAIVTNYGTINGLSLAGVAMAAGGTIINGGPSAATGLIAGFFEGVYALGGPVTVINFGTIIGTYSAGVAIQNGGVSNGGPGANGALISGYVGVYGVTAYGAPAGSVTVANYGTIRGTGGTSVLFNSTHDRLIVETGSTFIGAVQGGGGTLELGSGTGAVAGLGSSGTVSGSEALKFSGFGSYVLDSGGSWTLTGSESLSANQTLSNNGALVVRGTLANAGTIFSGGGISLASGGLITNGGAGATKALISGTVGIYAGPTGAAIVVNYGTIQGTGGDAIIFGSAGDRLIVEAGSTILGAARGGGGTLELASGTGTITGLGAVGILSGGASLSFSGFGSYVLDGGGTWSLAGMDSLTTSQTLTSAGALNIAGSLANAGTVASGASVNLAGGGVVTNGGGGTNGALISGVVGIYAGPAGHATVTNFGTIQGTGGTSVQFMSSADKLIVGAGATFVGAVHGGGGALELGAGTATFTGLGTSFTGFGSYQIDAGGFWTFTGANSPGVGDSLTVAGSLVNVGTIAAGAAAGVVLTPGGNVTNGGKTTTDALVSGTVGVYAGPTGAATITNYGSIVGTGGIAVKLTSASDRLIAEAGSTWVGVAQGGGGILELAGGTGTITGLGVGGTVTGPESLSFSGFGAYQLDAGSSWTLAGSQTLAANQRLTVFGAVSGNLKLGFASDRLIIGSGASFDASVSGGGGTLELGAGAATLTGLGTNFTGFGAYQIDAAGIWTLTGTNTMASANSLTVAGSLINSGSIVSPAGDGVVLTAGGSVTNGSKAATGALISGGIGVYAGLTGPATITNYGSIQGTSGVAVQLMSAADRLIVEAGSTWIGAVQGGGGTLELAGGTGTITGFGAGGSISGPESLTFGGFGAYQLDAGSSWILTSQTALAAQKTIADFGTIVGTVSLGSKTDRMILGVGATISGPVAGGGGMLELASGTGTISGIGATGTVSGSVGVTFSGFGLYGIDAGSGWTLAGTNTLTKGKSLTVAGSLGNTGALTSSAANGVVLTASGSVINGISGATNALIAGVVGVYAGATSAGTLTNFGTIQGSSGTSVRFKSSQDRLIAETGSSFIGSVQGGGGTLELAAGAGTISGLGFTGTVSGPESVTFTGFGSYLLDAGGSWTLTGIVQVAAGKALVSQGSLTVAGTLTNAGSISSNTKMTLAAASSITNGSSTNAKAVISGAVDIYAGPLGAATVTNFGTITGTSGVAIQFKSSTDRLIAASGSAAIGLAQGGGGALELAAATGAITGLGTTGIVSGPEALTFSGFGSYFLDAGGFWTLNGIDTVAAGHTLSSQGTLNVAGALSVKGSIIAGGNIVGSGTLSLGGSAVESVTTSATQSVTLSQAHGTTITIAASQTLTLTGSGDSLAGATTGKGTVAFNAGTHVIASGATMTVSNWSLNGGTTTLNEALSYKGKFSEGAGATLSVFSGNQLTLSGTATLSGIITGGGVVASTKTTILSGVTIGGATTLQLSGNISQSGNVAVGDNTSISATMSIGKGSTYTIANAFNIAKGASVVSKLQVAGTLLRTGAAGLSVIGPQVYDAGLIEAGAGTLDLAGIVYGPGALKVDAGATLELDASVANTLSLSFAGASATVALRSPLGFAATISGFAVSDTIDLLGQSATAASINASDQLLIVNGATVVAKLQLAGTYTGATFVIGSDGKGGTNVTLLTAAKLSPPAASPLAFTSAMASLGDGGGPVTTVAANANYPRPALLAPRA